MNSYSCRRALRSRRRPMTVVTRSFFLGALRAMFSAGGARPSPTKPGTQRGFGKNMLNLPLQSSAVNAILSPFARDREVSPTPTTEGVILDGACSVLIVDRSPSTREVLQTALERRGVRTLAVGRPEAGLELARRHHPELIVLDLDDTPGCLPAGQQLWFSRTIARAGDRRTTLSATSGAFGQLARVARAFAGWGIRPQALPLRPLDS